MYNIRYLPLARNDIENIVAYVELELKSPKAAMGLLLAFEEAIKHLSLFPYAYKPYRFIEPIQTDYRMLPVKNYAVFYVIDEENENIEIHRVIYAKRDLSNVVKQ